ncbi:MAG: RDD family protein [Chloroflexota bacterium]
MSWQTPGKDGPDPSDEPSSGSPEPDAETTRVPVSEGANDPVPPPPSTPGLISAKPVGWVDPNAAQGSASQAGDPAVVWAPPVQPQAPVVSGLVIARTFTRLVAYAVDLVFLGLLNLSVLGVLATFNISRDSSADLALGIGFVVVDCLYFIGLWTSGWNATLGMRLLRLRVMSATSGGKLPYNDALLRWIALSGAAAILALVPGVPGTLGFLAALWLLILLATTATNPLHQGLHDRWARSVVVQPAPGGTGAAVLTCLVMTVLLFLVLPVALLAFAGPQLEDLLRQIGESV